MNTYREYITEHVKVKKAIGHFNISTIEALWAIVLVAQQQGVPVIIGLSEGERDFIGLRQAIALVQSIRNEYNQPIFINADHTYSVARVKEAIDAGVDSVIFDGAKLTLEENIKATKECVAYARASGRDVLVEGELGYIGSSSDVLDTLPEGAAVTRELMVTPEDASRYVVETGVDLFAPAVGNVHGKLKNTPNPRLDIQLIEKLREAAGVPLVLHGGSGIADEDFVAAIHAGMSIVHINTEIRFAWRQALETALVEQDVVAPYKLLAPSADAIKKVVAERLTLFNN